MNRRGGAAMANGGAFLRALARNRFLLCAFVSLWFAPRHRRSVRGAMRVTCPILRPLLASALP